MEDKKRDLSSTEFKCLSYEQQVVYLRRFADKCDSDADNDISEDAVLDPNVADDELVLMPVMRSEPLHVDDSDVEDVFEDPDIEIEIDENDENSDSGGSDEDTAADDHVLRGIDNTVWKLAAPPGLQTPKQNILRQKSRPSRSTKSLSMKDTFKCIFNEVMCNIIIKQTNRKANNVYSEWNNSNPDKNPKVWKEITQEEFDDYLGILITVGVRHSSSEDVKELWKIDAYPLYRVTMAINRFWAITRFLRFDNANTRPERLKNDKEAAISELWLLLNNNLRTHYVPSECVTVDEQLFPYRGRTRLQYMPAKPAKYGIKMWWACDSSNSYPLTGQIYTGKSTEGSSKERCKTPDSPEGSRLNQPVSPSQSSPQRQPTNGSTSPVNNGSTDSITPPLTASTALTVSLDANQSQQYGHAGIASCVTRPLIKVKRFLSTLVQFGSDISSDVGDRVRSLVLNLVSSNLSVEEFHHSLQEVTNFPLRPFVLPFLRAHLPLLQREIHTLARTNKQSSLQYVRTHEHMVLDSAHSPTEPSEIFLPNDTMATGIKRRASDSIYENGINGQSHQDSQDFLQAKRPFASQNAFMFAHQSLLLPNMNTTVPNSHVFDYTQHGHIYPNQHRTDEDNNRTPNRGDEEWRNIHVMLNCILSMVEKTKRALSILQQRNSQDVTNDWLRKQDVSVDLKKAANDIMMQAVRQTEDRVAEVRRRAEEAVNDVKRQAVIELQKAVAAAESKANELVAAERAKMEKLLLETRKHTEENNPTHATETSENSLSPPQTVQSASSQQSSCWNCGRKAHETCSGCNVARYCGPFCQHKDWETHHQVCSKDKTRPIRSATPSTTGTAIQAHVNPVEQVKFKK